MPKPRAKEFVWGVTLRSRPMSKQARENFDMINWNDGSKTRPKFAEANIERDKQSTERGMVWQN